MKTLLAMFAALLLASPVQAEDWVLLADLNGGSRLLYDKDSIEISPWGNVLSMTYKPAEKEWSGTAKIYINECIQKQKGTVSITYAGGEATPYLWFFEGKKVYDLLGQTLCIEVFEAGKELVAKEKGEVWEGEHHAWHPAWNQQGEKK